MLAVADEVWYRGTRCVNEISRIDPTMNLPSFFASPSRLYPTRRDFFRRTGGGLGMLALAGLLDQQGLLTAAGAGQESQPVGGAAQSFSRQGQVGHLALHERRAEPGRYLGLQTGVGQARR